MKPSPLYPGQSVFIMVQPRYVNVDIRIILDVSEGSLDLRMSPKDDFLVVDPGANVTDKVNYLKRKKNIVITYRNVRYRTDRKIVQSWASRYEVPIGSYVYIGDCSGLQKLKKLLFD